jgi:hypothetical protein
MHAELAWSGDGERWDMLPKHPPLFAVGQKGAWDAGMVLLAESPVAMDDELWFYYRGSRSNERDKTDYYTMSVGLARLRRDGFVSLNAGEKPGRLVTRPLTFAGKSLFVNVEVAEGGWIKAAVLSRDSKPVAGYTTDDAVALTKGTTRGRMAWKTKVNLDPPGDDHVRIVFQLENAKLYSFWIE